MMHLHRQSLSSSTRTMGFLPRILPVVALLLTFSNAFQVSPMIQRKTVVKTSTRLFAFKKTASSSPMAEEALASFPFKFLPENSNKKRVFTEITRSQAIKAYSEISNLYGDDRALRMVKIQPTVLCFDSKKFQPSFQVWSDIFGEEGAQAMVERNPGLLGIPPELAGESTEATMALSYIVWVTRPLPKIVAAAGLLAICTAGLFPQR